MIRSDDTRLDPFLSRPFFAHDYKDGIMSLLVVVRGRGTALLADAGPELLVSEPLGRGFEISGTGPVALVGGGVWISPLKLLSRTLRLRGIDHNIYLETLEDASSDYLRFVSESFPEAAIFPAANGSEGIIEQIGDLSRYEALYVSGTASTLAAAKDAAAGVVSAQLAVREQMACANGSCYGCAVPVWSVGERTFVRACVEGPVFSAESLAW